MTLEATLPAVRVCAWCPDKATKDAAARTAGQRVTHGICAVCLQKEFQSLALRQVERDLTPDSFAALAAVRS